MSGRGARSHRSNFSFVEISPFTVLARALRSRTPMHRFALALCVSLVMGCGATVSSSQAPEADAASPCACPATGAAKVSVACYCGPSGCPGYDALMARIAAPCDVSFLVEEFRTPTTIIVHHTDGLVEGDYVFDRSTHAFVAGRTLTDTGEDCTGGDYDTRSAPAADCDLVCVDKAGGAFPHCTTLRDAGVDASSDGG